MVEEGEPIRCQAWCSQYPNCQHDWREWHHVIEQRKAEAAARSSHEAGCSYGGLSCGWWIVVPGCPEYHPETHIVRDDRCPCGNEFPGFGDGLVVSDADNRPLPSELQQGLGTPLELWVADV